MLMLGLVLGFILGAKATRDAAAMEERRQADRLARREARAARTAGAAGDETGPPPSGTTRQSKT